MTGSIKLGSQWPCPSDDHPGTQILHGESFPIGKKASLRRIPYRATLEVVTEEFPFILTTGRTLYQFNAGTMTLRTRNEELHPADFLDISPEDAKRLERRMGKRSDYAAAMACLFTGTFQCAVKQGELFATFHTAEVFLNNVTSPYRDRYVLAPEYKVTAVRIDKIP